MNEVKSQNPKFQAAHDYREGGDLSDNPYQKASELYREYALEMHRLQREELDQLRRGFA